MKDIREYLRKIHSWWLSIKDKEIPFSSLTGIEEQGLNEQIINGIKEYRIKSLKTTLYFTAISLVLLTFFVVFDTFLGSEVDLYQVKLIFTLLPISTAFSFWIGLNYRNEELAIKEEPNPIGDGPWYILSEEEKKSILDEQSSSRHE